MFVFVSCAVCTAEPMVIHVPHLAAEVVALARVPAPPAQVKTGRVPLVLTHARICTERSVAIAPADPVSKGN